MSGGLVCCGGGGVPCDVRVGVVDIDDCFHIAGFGDSRRDVAYGCVMLCTDACVVTYMLVVMLFIIMLVLMMVVLIMLVFDALILLQLWIVIVMVLMCDVVGNVCVVADIVCCVCVHDTGGRWFVCCGCAVCVVGSRGGVIYVGRVVDVVAADVGVHDITVIDV